MPAKHRKIAMLAAKLTKEGWRVRYGRKHVVFYPPDKARKAVVAGTTTTSWLGATRLFTELRSAGADVKMSELQ